MSTQTIRRTVRQADIMRFALDVEEWLALRAAVPAEVEGTTPTGFAPENLGREEASCAHQRAWESLCERGLMERTDDDVAALTPELLRGLRTLLRPEVRLEAGSWHGDVVVDRAVGWAGGRTASLARRRHLVPGVAGELEPEDVVELSLAADGVLLGDVLRALPDRDGSATAALPSPVRVDLPGQAGIAQAPQADVAARLACLPPRALDGATDESLVGGASVSGSRRGDTDGVHAFHGVWLWTGSNVVELTDASADGVLLRPTDVAQVRSGVVSALSGLLQAPEPL